VSVVKQLTTVSEFDKWPTYFRMRREQRDKTDWYSAAICHTLAAVNGNKSKIGDYLLVFEDPEEKKPKDSKNVWLMLLGITPPE
jgi:hypothetical protein